MLENLAISSDFSKLNPYSKVDTANGMPINYPRIVDPVHENLRAKEFVQKQNLREVYSKNLAPSIGYDTEKFLKARDLLSPVYSYNEAQSKYDMVSRIPINSRDIRSQLDLLA